MKYKLAIFDLDGTILNTIEDLADATNYTLEQFSYPLRTLDEVRRFVGNGIRNLLIRAAPAGLPDEKIDELFSVFYQYYLTHSDVKTRPYDGIPELLSALREKGMRLAVVSNKADAAVKRLMEQYFPGCFDAAVGERTNVRRKPAPDSVFEVLTALGFERTKAVYIGDSEVDVQTAANAGMDCIAVSWGFRDREILMKAGAKHIVSTPEELLDSIL